MTMTPLPARPRRGYQSSSRQARVGPDCGTNSELVMVRLALRRLLELGPGPTELRDIFRHGPTRRVVVARRVGGADHKMQVDIRAQMGGYVLENLAELLDPSDRVEFEMGIKRRWKSLAGDAWALVAPTWVVAAVDLLPVAVLACRVIAVDRPRRGHVVRVDEQAANGGLGRKKPRIRGFRRGCDSVS